MDDVVFLIRELNQVDANFNPVARKDPRQVFCRVRSVSRSEFYSAGQQGLHPALVLDMFQGDYHGERIAEFRGKEYVIYRTYQRVEDDSIELYLEEKAGV